MLKFQGLKSKFVTRVVIKMSVVKEGCFYIYVVVKGITYVGVGSV